MSSRWCEGKKVYLRVVESADAELITGWKRDPVVVAMALSSSSPVEVEEQREDIERALKSESQFYAVVVIRSEERPVGYIRINWMEDAHRSAWLRFALGERRGEGFGEDALRAFVAKLFEGGANRVEAETYETNAASRRVLEKLGFVLEGRKREACYTEEGYLDLFVLGLLRREFVAVPPVTD